ncbi:MAG: sugar kinase [Candidatus Latescibacteria bacterium]|nr:sugar kinase [Candidatus Latescibacterota bacterium]
MLRFSPIEGEMLEQANTLHVNPAGSESSTAVALSRMGLDVAWVSALPDSPPGRWIADRLKMHGVDTSHTIWTDDRMGAFFYEQGTPPRGSRVVYDRADSAVSRLTPQQIDWQRVADTRLMHISGITPALSEDCRDIAIRALRETRANNGRTSMDINFRAKLWSPDAAAATLSPLLKELDILISTASDIELLFDIRGTEAQVITQLRDRFGPSIIVITLATGGAFGWSEQTGLVETGPHSVEQVDRLGAGDAFDAGLIYGILDDDLQLGLSCGSSLAALSYSEEGDIAWPTIEEVLTLTEVARGG